MDDGTLEELLAAARAAAEAADDGRAATHLADAGHRLAAARRHVEAADAFERAASHFGSVQRPELRAQALANAGVSLCQANQPKEGMILSGQASELFAALGDRAAQCRVEANIAVMHRDLGEAALAVAAAERAESLADPSDLASLVALQSLQAELCAASGQATEALRRAERALRSARGSGLPLLVGRQLEQHASLLVEYGEADQALPACFEAFVHARDGEDAEAQYRVTVQLALAYQLTCRWADSLAALHQARQLAARLGHADGMARLQAAVAASLVALGRFEEAHAEARAAVAGYRALDDAAGEGRALITLGQCVDRLGDPAAARSCWQQAADLLAGIDAEGSAVARQLLAAAG